MRIFIEGVVAWAIIVALFYLAFAFVSLDWWWITSEAREAYVGRLLFTIGAAIAAGFIFDTASDGK